MSRTARTESTLQITGLARQKVAALRRHAQSLGMTAERYARELIERGLSLERLARSSSFEELFAAVQARFRTSGITEQDLDKLVDRARTRHHRRSSRKRR
ncbi:hypothetical protein [Fontivita pretiosa]|jgi:hypothetical protein|uniref:hypothetical protein n=1 Tax=Fontivita pretiosa TaxID=2989684 RepID=UPI003D185018